ncbi:uncharacterized protein GGS22DRAFT_184027 [Annulohypoxylon maeteangense]|uniref:uncharacterized protein n=1 Tax=Annulohypoxylon maeteangense TaxID=1927788 RepID=UPI002007F04A|nr:uncharacterized protein GGS22DRAFT_184027 [Annulohypoxylon maeteangense]KAI0890678.1 hypothetical protein GGS22DRAFT_184027 [Annulohypoxylon maeteangense]
MAICGAGQQATPGVANVRDGLTIHLGNLRGITLNSEKRIVSIAAGGEGQMWGGKVFYFQPSFSGQIQNLAEYPRDPKADYDIHICVSLGYAGAFDDFVYMNDVFCTRPEKPKTLEPSADIQPQIDQMKTLRIDNLKSFTSEGFANRVAKNVHYFEG